MNDSAVFDKDLYLNLLRRIFGTKPDRHVEYKEVVMNELTDAEAMPMLDTLATEAESLREGIKRSRSYLGYWKGKFPAEALRKYIQYLEECATRFTDSKNQRLLALLPEIPVLRRLGIYRISRYKWVGMTMAALFPIGLPLWLYARRSYRNLDKDLTKVASLRSSVAEG